MHAGFFDWLSAYGERHPEELIFVGVFIVLSVLGTTV